MLHCMDLKDAQAVQADMEGIKAPRFILSEWIFSGAALDHHDLTLGRRIWGCAAWHSLCERGSKHILRIHTPQTLPSISRHARPCFLLKLASVLTSGLSCHSKRDAKAGKKQ